MNPRLPHLRLALLAATSLLWACATQPIQDEPVPLELVPVTADSVDYAGTVRAGTTLSPSEAWVVDYLATPPEETDTAPRSHLMLTDPSNDAYYEIAMFRDRPIRRAAWDENEKLFVRTEEAWYALRFEVAATIGQEPRVSLLERIDARKGGPFSGDSHRSLRSKGVPGGACQYRSCFVAPDRRNN